MRDWVSEWKQEGQLFIWRYAKPRQSWRGWHFTADPAGCHSIRNLLDRMRGGAACHRTLRLSPVTDAVLSVPNFGSKCDGRFEKLRIEYEPEGEDLALVSNCESLTMTVGEKRLRFLSSAFADVEVGQGDFGIRPSNDRKIDPWMFWWMPRSTR